MHKEEFVETPPSEAMAKARATRNPLRKAYFWTLHWADTRFAVPALAGISFIESSLFPVPPDVLLIGMVFAKPKKWAAYAFWCTIASVAGGVLGWAIGYWFWHAAQGFLFSTIPGFTPETFAKVETYYQQNAFLAVLTAAFTPIPYKVFTIASGVFNVPLWTLISASLVGRGGRFFLVAGMIRLFGPAVKPFLEKYFEIATLLLTAVAIAGFLAIKYLAH